jgi:hypothetical protein
MGVLDCVGIVTTTAFYRCIVPPFTPPRAQSVESMCLQKRAADVYTQLHAWLDEYLRASMSALHAAFARLDTPEFLGAAPQIFHDPALETKIFASSFHKHEKFANAACQEKTAMNHDFQFDLLRCLRRSESHTDAVNAFWESFNLQLRTVRSVFLYLDRTYVINKPDVRHGREWMNG